MKVRLLSGGCVVIPQQIRKRFGFKPGDQFIVEDPDSQTIVLRKLESGADWFKVLMQCPSPLDLPARRRQFYTKQTLFD